ncbi:hypothetical protein SAMN05880501_11625 [Ureibacillus xyleni]|uniref:Uncharacterized protein n=1 Tax=Ureibacillus xyleni TaxID=614648 RepID=A0A285TMN6_9BACL|nr:hypothetical protein SAMN05880501_11625 [Ureibacillus xyleni]
MSLTISYGGVPVWFFVIAIVFVIVFIIVSEWNSRS